MRGHHLLCLLGYRGEGYSPQFTENMTRIYETLRNAPSTRIRLVEGEDDICSAFPREVESHCCEQSVHRRDDAVLRRLQFKPGDCLSWNDILKKTAAHVRAHDIRAWCSTCPWRPLGYCEAGVSRTGEGGSLPPLEDTAGKQTHAKPAAVRFGHCAGRQRSRR
ncbi:MAG: DUF1284 domain-containing protein [Acidobacteriota bacterium]